MKSKFILLMLVVTFSNINLFAAPQKRTITIYNNCPSAMLWGMTGTPIQTNGGTISCDTPGEACKGWDGSNQSDEGICGEDKTCYFSYPKLTSAQDAKPYYYLAKGQTRTYQITPVSRKDKNGAEVTQYTFNIGPQYDCKLNTATGLYSCKSGECGGRIAGRYDGQCQPSKGQLPPFSQIEMTTNDKQNDFYDISIINGMNIPVKIEPVGKHANQKMQSNFWCTSPGAAPNSDPKKLNGCSWAFDPPNFSTIKPEVFVQIDKKNTNVKCATDSDCKTGQKCGLEYPEDLKTYNKKRIKPAYCGTPLGYYTATQICNLGGLSADLQSMFECNDTKNITLTAPGGAQLNVSSNDYYKCNTQGAWTDGSNSGSFLDSCYNYKDKPFSTSGFCCGCIDWDGIPTDDSVSCAKKPSNSGPTSSTVFPSAEWLSLVKPKLKWLVDGCPDAYEYQYGDKHGTIQCSTVNPATTSGNAMNYKVTFCPQGKTLFTHTAKGSITLSKPDVKVRGHNSAVIHWTVTPQPSSGKYISSVRLKNVSSSTRTCGLKDCTFSYNNLAADTSYLAIVAGKITSGGKTVKAVPRFVRFKTNKKPSTQTIKIKNSAGHVLSHSSVNVSWDMETAPVVATSSHAEIVQDNSFIINTKSCEKSHCNINFSGLSSNTNYQIEINASGGGAQASPQTVYVKTKEPSKDITVTVPNKGQMNLSNVIGPGAYCKPTTYRFPLMELCQSGKRAGYRCVNVTIDDEVIGEWYINQKPSCLSQSKYSFSHLSNLVALYHGGDISLTFYPNSPWKCAADGGSLTCSKS